MVLNENKWTKGVWYCESASHLEILCKVVIISRCYKYANLDVNSLLVSKQISWKFPAWVNIHSYVNKKNNFISENGCVGTLCIYLRYLHIWIVAY